MSQQGFTINISQVRTHAQNVAKVAGELSTAADAGRQESLDMFAFGLAGMPMASLAIALQGAVAGLIECAQGIMTDSSSTITLISDAYRQTEQTNATNLAKVMPS